VPVEHGVVLHRVMATGALQYRLGILNLLGHICRGWRQDGPAKGGGTTRDDDRGNQDFAGNFEHLGADPMGRARGPYDDPIGMVLETLNVKKWPRCCPV